MNYNLSNEVLYDIVTDHDEIRNLADHEQYQEVLDVLRAKTDNIIFTFAKQKLE